MPLIPAQRTVEKDTLSLRLDRAVHERLKQYATFIQSPKDYIIGQALRRLFEKDHEFAAWLTSHKQGAAASESRDPGVGSRARLAMPAAGGARTRIEG